MAPIRSSTWPVRPSDFREHRFAERGSFNISFARGVSIKVGAILFTQCRANRAPSLETLSVPRWPI